MASTLRAQGPRAAHARPLRSGWGDSAGVNTAGHAKLLQFLNQSHGSHMCDPYATLASCSTSSSAERRQEWPVATARPRRAMS